MDNPNVRLSRRRSVQLGPTVNLRRHNTLSGPLHNLTVSSRSHSARAANCSNSRLLGYDLKTWKSNPYVGWFRHAPAHISLVGGLSCAHPKVLEVSKIVLKNTGSNKRRIDDGFAAQKFRKLDDSQRTKALQCLEKLLAIHQKLLENQNGHSPSSKYGYYEDVHQKHRLFDPTQQNPEKPYSGYLPGGAEDGSDGTSVCGRLADSNCYAPHSKEEAASMTIQLALSRLAYWFLDVPEPNSTSTIPTENVPKAVFVGDDNPSSESNNCSDEDLASRVSDDDDDVDHSDDESTDRSTQRPEDAEAQSSCAATLGSSFVLSSQAEAYYAIASVHSQILQEASSNNRRFSMDDMSSRLDFDITQMDILRMNRVASRHLEVESIVKLPIIEYRSKKKMLPLELSQKDNPITSNTDDSWMLVHSSSIKAETPLPPTNSPQQMDDIEDDSDVCVICLEHFRDRDRLRILPCQHLFHVGCIDRWLSGSHSFGECYTSGCPTCKKRPDEHHPHHDHQQQQEQVPQLDGSVPSWAFAKLGDALVRQSRYHF
jgi:hypothetical protein